MRNPIVVMLAVMAELANAAYSKYAICEGNPSTKSAGGTTTLRTLWYCCQDSEFPWTTLDCDNLLATCPQETNDYCQYSLDPIAYPNVTAPVTATVYDKQYATCAGNPLGVTYKGLTATTNWYCCNNDTTSVWATVCARENQLANCTGDNGNRCTYYSLGT